MENSKISGVPYSDAKRNTTKFNTRRLVIISILGTLSIVLGMTPLGFIPLGFAKATTMHIPVIIGAILEGPFVGFAVGLIFGITSIIQSFTAPTPISFIFWNPMVSILPRVAIGIVAYFSFTALLKVTKKPSVSAGIAAFLATATNTIGVLGMAYIFFAQEIVEKLGLPQGGAAIFLGSIAATNGIAEAMASCVIVFFTTKAMFSLNKN
ncbi:MAG: ECF transporter S component [Filifactoraceae bacterium]